MICRICNHDQAGYAFQRAGRNYLKCPRCQAVTVDLTHDQYIALTPSYDPGPPINSVDVSAIRRLLGVDEKVELLRHFVDRVPAAARFLDIGCGAGAYLLAAKELGWDVKGVEPSESHSRMGRAMGLTIDDGYFRAEDFPPDHFDFVLLSHVIEHIYDQKKFISDMLTVTRTGGIGLLITPNVEGIASMLAGKFWVMFKPVDHISMLGPSSFNFLKPSNGNISWRTDEYSAEIVISVLAALRDALLESRGAAPFDGVASAAASSDDQSGWRRYEFRRRLNAAAATLSWPLHFLAKVSQRQACLLVEIEKDA
jgi:SAM-dependent methyltransferase